MGQLFPFALVQGVASRGPVLAWLPAVGGARRIEGWREHA
jgi:hypothetical protein